MSAVLIHSVAELRKRVAAARRSGAVIGLVPTMGALHAGHASLIERARAESGCVVVSIFVNRTQFNQQDDYQRYPRSLPGDLETCNELGVDMVFAPPEEEVYPQPQQAFVEVGAVSEHLCGKFRPGHFRAVATVVLKLFQMAQPDRAYFGEKDAQQLAVIRRMVADLNVPVTVVGLPTVRESDGLALSSRNRLLSPAERRASTALYRGLRAVQDAFAAGERDAAALKRAGLAIVGEEAGVRLEYFEVVDAEEMQPVDEVTRPSRVAGAIWVGSTRLIDNVLLAPEA